MQAILDWAGGLRFDVAADSGASFSFDSVDEGRPAGPSPMEALLSSIAACTAMDVISILEKKRQKVSSYRIEIKGERPPKREWPRPFTTVTVNHILSGDNLDEAAIARAIQLSEEKYCSVSATLRTNPKVINTWEVN